MTYNKIRHLNRFEDGLTDEYRITTEKGFYSLIVDYIGCVGPDEDINDLDTDPNAPAQAIQAWLQLSSEEELNDEIIELFNDNLDDIEKGCYFISGIDTSSYDSTQSFISELLESL